MQVILLQDIKGIGKKGELKEIKNGYSRNFLIPRKMAMAATGENLKQWHRQQLELQAREQRHRMELEKQAQEISQLTYTHELLKDKTGGIFGAVNKQTIKDFLMRHYIKVSSEQIKLEHSLKDQDEYRVPIDLGQGIEAVLKIVVVHKQQSR